MADCEGVDMAEASRTPCPTPCDPDCEVACHELHEVRYKREHDPDDCKKRQVSTPDPAAALALMNRVHARLDRDNLFYFELVGALLATPEAHEVLTQVLDNLDRYDDSKKEQA